MKNKSIILIIFSLIIITSLACFLDQGKESDDNSSLPLENKIEDLIFVEAPLVNSNISSPLKYYGRARGSWFFEGDFPVVLVDWDGKIISEGLATAQGDWMTEDFVSFEGEINFKSPVLKNIDYTRRGTLIFQKDNPSDFPKYDNALEFDIYFK